MKNVRGRSAAAAACVALCLAVASGAGAATGSGAPRPEGFATLTGHVLPALARATPVVVEQRARVEAVEIQPLTLTVVLRRTDPAAFQVYLHDAYDLASPIFHKFLTPVQVTERFGPSQDDYDAVRRYFEAQGLTAGESSANRMTLTVSGAREAVEHALSVSIADYKIGERQFYANDAEPSLPPDIAARVEAVIGLSNLAQPRAEPMVAQFELSLISAFCSVAGFFGGIGNVWNFDAGYLKAYARCLAGAAHNLGLGTLTAPDPPPPAWQGVDGTGQTIGVVAFDTFQMSDVSDYLAFSGHPAGNLANLSQVHVGGGASPGADQSEVLLDIAMIMSSATGAHVKVFDAPFTGAGSFQAVFNAMIGDGVTIISNSWAYCEDQTTLADVTSIDTVLQTAAASGITAISGSGDHGSTCLDGAANTAHVPATSPYITAVGGTSQTLGPGFTYGSEAWWDSSASTPPGGQGGFGVSRFFARPAYQTGLSGSAFRSVPDVGANADPLHGVMICQASAGGCPSGLLYGGTSAAAPLWAAFAAELNQSQGTNLGFLNAQIYALAATDSFHSPASMGTDFAHVGLGSPNLARLHQHLTGQTAGTASASVSVVQVYSEGMFAMPESSGLPLPVPADGTSKAYVVVRLADANGNVVDGKTVALSAGGGSAVIAPPSGVSKTDNGAVIFVVTDLTAETLTFTATDTSEGVVLAQTAQVAFGVPPAASGGISAAPTSVASDGLATTTITVTLKDALNRPTPGKLITLDQGSGHSIITGPSPAITDAGGQIQFSASDGVSETVTYTATDVTDNSVPVPGSAVVNFTGGSTSCIGAPPVAGSGFSIAPWATGFFAQNFFYGGVNWGGCSGASNPTFTPSGTALIADFRTGDLFSLDLSGGASAGHLLLNLTPTLGQPTFGKDGRLYASHGSTGGGISSGDIVEIDPATGAQLRVVAANLTCPNGLSVDPLSGDLFFDDECFGGGSDNPSIWRIADPAGAATLSVYATLPATPNGQLAFAPDGTLYAVTGYNSVQQVVQVGGTNTSSPPAMAALAGIQSFFCVTMGQAQGSGAAKALIVCDTNGVELIDITTTPFTRTVLISSGTAGSGSIGPDGCLYTSGQDTVYKLSPNAGGCGFVPTNPSPTLALTPATVTPNPAQGSSQTFTATFRNVSVPTGTPVLFSINGPNARRQMATTDASGAATVTYIGALIGTDTVVASATAGALVLTSNPAHVTWGAGKHLTYLDLSTSPSGGTVGQSVTVTASLSDATLNPLAAIAGASIHFTLGAQSCNGVTNASGLASCSITPAAQGQLILSASYPGSASYTSSAASQVFGVLVVAGSGAPPGAPTIGSASAGDDRITVMFAPPGNDGGSAITSYTVACTPVGGGTPLTATGSGSPITVFGLTNGVTYTCTVSATNNSGPGASSAASNPATPIARPVIVQQPIPTLTRSSELVLIGLLALLAGVALRRRKTEFRT